MVELNRKHRLKPFMVSNNPVQTRAIHEPSAAIHIDDTNGGFLTARMTTTQRDLIPQPTQGVLVWNLDIAQFEYYDGTKWVTFGGSAVIDTGLNIPPPAITIDKGKTTTNRNIRVFFTESASHLATLNPRFILMRYKSGRKSPSSVGGRYYHKRWVHPTHRNGISGVGNINTGGHYSDAGLLIPPRDTEWNPVDLGPFQDTSIMIDFAQWYGGGLASQGLSGYAVPSGYHNASGYGVRSITQHFAFVVEVDNIDPATSTQKRRVRGPMSPVITTRWNRAGGEFDITIGGGIPNSRRFVP